VARRYAISNEIVKYYHFSAIGEDDGIDGVGYKNVHATHIFKVIKTTNVVGREIIRELSGAGEIFKRKNNLSDPINVVITSGRFTSAAVEVGERINTKLIDGDELVKWIAKELKKNKITIEEYLKDTRIMMKCHTE
jgi:restriction endonuclease Mrr